MLDQRGCFTVVNVTIESRRERNNLEGVRLEVCINAVNDRAKERIPVGRSGGNDEDGLDDSKSSQRTIAQGFAVSNIPKYEVFPVNLYWGRV